MDVPLVIETYTDPGVYQGEVVAPGAIAIGAVPAQLGILAVGSREKRVTNEAVQRGRVEDDTLTVVNITGTASGTDTLSTPVGDLQTLTIAAAPFTTDQVIGSEVTIRGSTAGAGENNRVSVIVNRLSTTQIVFRNPGGVPDPAFGGTFSITPFTVIGGESTPVRTTRALQHTAIFRNGKVIPTSFLGFRKAHIQTAAAGPFDLHGTHAACVAATNGEIVIGVGNWVATGTGATHALEAPVNGASYNTFDGVTLTTPGDRLLVWDADVTAFGKRSTHNGIYELTTLGTIGAKTKLTRVSDFNATGVGAIELGAVVFVIGAGATTYRQRTFRLVTQGTLTIDVPTPTALEFQVGGPSFSLSMDGKVPLTVVLTGSTGATTVNGTQVTVKNSALTGLTDLTNVLLPQLVAAINEAISPADSTAQAALVALGYGATFAGAATLIGTTGLRIASPTTLSTSNTAGPPVSDVRVSSAFAQDVLVTLFGAAGPLNRDAPSIVEIKRVAFVAGAIYTADYVNTADTSDTLANSSSDPINDPRVNTIVRVGTSPGISTFAESTDWSLLSDEVSWAPGAPAIFTPAVFTPTYDLSGVATTVRLNIDGRGPVDLQLVGLATPPIGWSNPVDTSAATADEIVGNINALLAAHRLYGPRYGSVAVKYTASGLDYVRLVSPTVSSASSINISVVSTASVDAAQIVFNLATAALPTTRIGSGKEPAPAAIYYVTYDVTRSATDYNVQKRFISENQAAADLGAANSDNPLMIGVRLAFLQKVSSVVVVQVDDASALGDPTRAEIQAALDATTNSDLITDVAVLATDIATAIDLKDHVESESAVVQKHYRRGWFGMSRETRPGDVDTPDTFIYRATQTLQVSPDSPGRGRFILVAPPQPQGVTVDLQLPDKTIERVALDSSYVALCAAAKQCSFTNPAEYLALKTVRGFNVDDIDLGSIWKPQERKDMARQGVMVVTFDAGNFTILDPVTTDQSGVAEFKYSSTSPQKDNITRKVDKALTQNIVGIVPSELSDFIIDIKLAIKAVLQGEIGRTIAHFKNTDGSLRRLDINADIEVEQNPDDPVEFFFNYTYNLLYPALRLLGQYSVDAPIPQSQ